MKEKKPIIGITMGDPSGIGPEIIAKALFRPEIYEICRPIVIGDAKVMLQIIDIIKKDLKINVVNKVSDAKFKYGIIDVYDLNNIDIDKLIFGKVSEMCGRAAGEYIEKTIEFASKGIVDATVTAPIHKEAFKLGGYGNKYPGHTEMYAALTNTKNYTMMLAHGNFRVVHVSTHVSLRKACDLVKKKRILDVIKIAHNACKSLGIENPKIAVAALNPHASDGGLFGDEEEKEIIPAIEEAKKQKMDVYGPFPSDTIFSRARGGEFDIVVTMYHDQGHIPMKLSGFEWDDASKQWKNVSGVNVTLGLPIIRVSVDHGVAFGKAGKGFAIPQSLIDSIYLATHMTNQNKKKMEVLK